MTEACVGETYGAAVAAWQATHARDPEVRCVMAEIARDELRHAALGHAIAEWASALLSTELRARVANANRTALAALASMLERESPAAEVICEAGMPSEKEARSLVVLVKRSTAHLA